MKAALRRFLGNVSGMTTTDYALIAVVVGVAIIAAVGSLHAALP